MNGGKKPLGYTIIEVMIVLAVSGVMFVIAAGFINGKQARTAFTAGVNEMNSQLQDLIDQVKSGKYSDIPLNCVNDGGLGGSIRFDDPALGGNQQGQNQDCVFLGKMIHLAEGGAGDAAYEIVPVAGNRYNSGGHPSTTPEESGAEAVTSLITQGTVPQGLDVSNVKVSNPDGSNAGNFFAIGFLQSQGSIDASTDPDNLLSGAQNIGLYYALGVNKGENTSTATAKIAGSNLQPAGRAEICLTDGTRYARIILGENGNTLDVETVMDGTAKVAGSACDT